MVSLQMSLKRLLSDFTEPGDEEGNSQDVNGHSAGDDQSLPVQFEAWGSVVRGLQGLLNGEDMCLEHDSLSSHAENWSDAKYNFQEIEELIQLDLPTQTTYKDSSTTLESPRNVESSNVTQNDQGFCIDPLMSQGASLSTTDTDVVCYGMIHRVPVKLIGDMMKLDQKLSIAMTKIQVFRIVKVIHIERLSPSLRLVFPDGTEFGTLDNRNCQALETMINNPELHLNGYVETNAVRNVIRRAQKATDAVIRVEIHIGGPLRLSEEVGSSLSFHKIWLQRPENPRFPYNNPQKIGFPGIDFEGEQVLNSEAESNVKAKHSAEEFQRTISHVYDTLKRDKDLNRVQGDTRLRTQLMEHQEEALDFMIQRETGMIAANYRLWRPESSNGESRFVHVITNHASSVQPDENGGGVLADEMGMGKSLCILSLVLRTLDNALQWSRVRVQQDMPEGSLSKRSRATLIIVSSALLINGWYGEIAQHLDEHTHKTLKTLRWHGPSRKVLKDDLMDSDIVITTYNTLTKEYSSKPSILHEIDWYRVVLDEAHTIRRQATKFFKACYDLSAISRWCLTGTPIQNKLEDIGTLFAFTRARPFHTLATFRQYIVTPYDEGGERRRVACDRLVLLLDSLCLRRTKERLHLPGRRDRVVEIILTEAERKQYNDTKKMMDRIIRHKAGVYEGHNAFNMFQAMLQLRILCNHGTFQRYFSWNRISNRDMREAAVSALGNDSEISCSACKLPMPVLGSNRIHNSFLEQCSHVLCSECLEGLFGNHSSPGIIKHCPMCEHTGTGSKNAKLPGNVHDSFSQDFRLYLENLNDVSEGNDDEYFRWNGHSSKMEALVRDIAHNLWSTKSIVFSCWTRTLNLIDHHLQRDRIPFERIDGGVPLRERQRILDKFAEDRYKPVLLMTTGTGAFGLNITAANRVFLVEPQWNPSVENQAIARTMRLGQVEQVLVTRYVVQASAENDISVQQKRKRQIASIGFT